MPLFTEGQEQELARWIESTTTGRYSRALKSVAMDPFDVIQADLVNNIGFTLPANWAQGTGGQDHGMYKLEPYVFTIYGRLPGFDLYTEKYSLVPEPTEYDLTFRPATSAEILQNFRIQLHRAKRKTAELLTPMLLKVFPQTAVLYTIRDDPTQNTTRCFA